MSENKTADPHGRLCVPRCGRRVDDMMLAQAQGTGASRIENKDPMAHRRSERASTNLLADLVPAQKSDSERKTGSVAGWRKRTGARKLEKGGLTLQGGGEKRRNFVCLQERQIKGIVGGEVNRVKKKRKERRGKRGDRRKKEYGRIWGDGREEGRREEHEAESRMRSGQRDRSPQNRTEKRKQRNANKMNRLTEHCWIGWGICCASISCQQLIDRWDLQEDGWDGERERRETSRNFR
ncbi:hypothetical protein GGI35DRAFT_143806 [Trichoderma velutinum]